MTRADIVLEAARRLGDTSATYLAEVDATFNFILSDLAAEEAIGDVVTANETQLVMPDQRAYSARDLTGLAPPVWPDRILALRVWAYGHESALERVPDAIFEEARMRDGEAARGRPRIWRCWPNGRQVQVHPPADAESSGVAFECLFLRPPAAITSVDEIEDIRIEDIETVVFGLQARLAPVNEETAADQSAAWQAYIAGRARMYARLHNTGIGHVVARD